MARKKPYFSLFLSIMKYRNYKRFLAERFPQFKEVRKLTVDAGFSCPNLSGEKGLHGCTFCNNESFSPALRNRGASIAHQIDEGIQKRSPRYQKAGVLVYFQPYSNTYAQVNDLQEIYAPALKDARVSGIAIGTRPDCLAPDILDWLFEIARQKPLILEVGLQTAHDQTLQKINRGHSVHEFSMVMDELTQRNQQERDNGFSGIDLCTHLIVGLPNETREDHIATAKVVGNYHLAAVKIHPLHIVRGTLMAQQWQSGEFELQSFEDYCQSVAAMLLHIPGTTAIERFTGDSPDHLHLAPDWCGQRTKIIDRVSAIMTEHQWVQGFLTKSSFQAPE